MFIDSINLNPAPARPNWADDIPFWWELSGSHCGDIQSTTVIIDNYLIYIVDSECPFTGDIAGEYHYLVFHGPSPR